MTTESSESNLVELATDLTIAWLSNPNTRVQAEEVPNFLRAMHGAVQQLAAPQPVAEEAPTPDYTPAVSVRRSLSSKDHLISLIDGKPYKTLKRHLSTNGLTPDQYRQRYNLKSDYPMVAETYAEMRRGLAKKIGLGRKPKAAAVPAAAATKAPAVKTPAAKASKAKVASAPKAPAVPQASAAADTPVTPPKAPSVAKAAAPAAVVKSPVEAKGDKPATAKPRTARAKAAPAA